MRGGLKGDGGGGLDLSVVKDPEGFERIVGVREDADRKLRVLCVGRGGRPELRSFLRGPPTSASTWVVR